jgi:hypothetical protein
MTIRAARRWARQALHVARLPGTEPSWETEAAYRSKRRCTNDSQPPWCRVTTPSSFAARP